MSRATQDRKTSVWGVPRAEADFQDGKILAGWVPFLDCQPRALLEPFGAAQQGLVVGPRVRSRGTAQKWVRRAAE